MKRNTIWSLAIFSAASFSNLAFGKNEISYGVSADLGRSIAVGSDKSWFSHLVFGRVGLTKTFFENHSLGLGFKYGTGSLQTSYERGGIEIPLGLNFYTVPVFELNYDYSLEANSIYVSLEQGWFHGRSEDRFPGQSRRTVLFKGNASGLQVGMKVPVNESLRLSLGAGYRAFRIDAVDSSKLQVNNSAIIAGAELYFGY